MRIVSVSGMAQDENKRLTIIKYDYLSHPVRIQFSNRSLME